MNFRKSRKVFIHIDCDSFFAECEILKNPKLKNKFVLVGREIVTACNYKCKNVGIKTTMPVWEADRILKGKGVFLDGDYNFYSFISDKMMSFLRENTLKVEPFSIDEAFCEITGLPELYSLSLEDYIKKLQKDVAKYIGVPVSIGVSTTRIKAKIFSKLNKPNGIFIDMGNSKEVYQNLDLAIVPFIGKSMQEKLKYKCHNVYDFINLGFFNLKKNIGKTATDLWLELSGVNAFVVRKNPESKSMSRGRSFNKNITNNKEFLYSRLLENFNNLFEEFSIQNYTCKKVSIFFRDKENITHIFHYNGKKKVFSRSELLKAITFLFNQNYKKNMLCRSTGVIFSNLENNNNIQLNIFKNINKKDNSNKNLFSVINKINSKYNSHKITFGMDMLGDDFESKLGIRK